LFQNIDEGTVAIEKFRYFHRHFPHLEIEQLIDTGVIQGGMIPKLRCCGSAIKGGVSKAHIVDGRREHAILLEIFTHQGIGTEITA